MANRGKEKCLTSPIIKEMEIKTTVKYLTPVIMATTKKTKDRFWHRCGKKGDFLWWWWECSLIQSLWITIGGSSRI